MKALFARLFARPEPAVAEVTSRDAAAIAELHAASFSRGWSEDEIERLLVDRRVLAHRVMAGRELAGFIMSRMAADEAEILSVAVAGRWRGRGLAGKLLALHLRRLAGLAVRTVFLEVEDGNKPAIRLYTHAGFREVARRPGYYQQPAREPIAALVLRRDL